MSNQFHYDAFISYRHVEPDKSIAEKLHKQIEAYKTPKNLFKKVGSRKLQRVFRDKDELPITSDLSESIQQALKVSRYLIVICSKKTNESKWIRREIEIFKKIHGPHNILALLVDGDPQTSFPRELRYEKYSDGRVEEVEPLAADIRASSLSASLHLLRSEKLRILAPLFGCTYDELKRRHRERFIRKLVFMATVIMMLSVLFGSMVLWQNFQIQAAQKIIEIRNNELNVEANKTKAQLNNALYNQSLYLAKLSGEQLSKGDVMMAKLLALKALPKNLHNPDRPFVEEAEAALRSASLHGKWSYYKPQTILYAYNASFSWDNKRIIAIDSETKSYGIWDANTLKKLITLPGIAFNSRDSSKFNHKGQMVATISINGDMLLWNSYTGVQVMDFHIDNCTFQSIEFSPDDTMLLTTNSDYTAKVWDVTTGKMIFQLAKADHAEFSPDGNYIVTTFLEENIVRIWNVQSLEIVKTCYFGKDYNMGVFSVAFSSDGRKIAVGCRESWSIIDTNLSVFPTYTDVSVLNSYGESDKENESVAFTPDGKMLVVASDSEVSLWNAQNEEMTRINTIPVQSLKGNNAEFSHDGIRLLVNKDQYTEILEISTNTDVAYDMEIFKLANYLESEYEQIICYDHHTVVTASENEVTVWNINKGREPAYELIGHTANVIAADISENGRKLATIADDGSVIVWDILTGKQLLFYKKYAASESQIKFCNCDNSIMFISNDKLTLLDAFTGKVEYIREIPDLCTRFLVINHDGSKAAVLADDDIFHIIDSVTGISLYDINGFYYPHDIKFSCDGKYIASSNGDCFIHIWNEKTGSLLYTIDNRTDKTEFVVFSPDNESILVDSFSGNISIRDITSGKLIATAELPTYVKNAYFSEDCKRIIAIDSDYDQYVLPIKPLEDVITEAIKSLCGREL